MSDSQAQSPSPTLLRIRGLKTVHAIREEMAAVYRDCRRKKLDTQDGSRLCFMLLSILRAVKETSVDERLDHLTKSELAELVDKKVDIMEAQLEAQTHNGTSPQEED